VISEQYRELNKKLHNDNASYGMSGARTARRVMRLVEDLGSRDVLDYGCGKRTLENALGFSIHNYDPAIEGLEAPPKPAEIVVCGDVLEHIEPDHLDSVLDDLKRVTLSIGLFIINTVPAMKFLSDGRNAHLIQENWRWWSPKILARFDLVQLETIGHDLWLVVKPYGAMNEA